MTSKDLIELLESHSLEFLENSTHIILKMCPNCGGKDKIMIDKSNLLWQCWKCKGMEQSETSKGNIYTLLTKVLQMDKASALNILKGKEQIFYTQDSFRTFDQVKVEKKQEERKVDEINIPSSWYLLDCTAHQIQSLKEPYKYLLSRFINTQKQICDYRLRYDSLNKRVVFPVYVDKGVIVGYQGRDITNRYKSDHPKCKNFSCKLFRKFYFYGEEVAPSRCPQCGGEIEETFYPKSINSKFFPKSELFFNQQNVDWNSEVVMVEGPFDSINVKNSIALLGRTISEQQILNLVNFTKNKPNFSLVLYLDGDKAGVSSTIEIYSKICWLFENKIKIVYIEDGDDPGAHSIEENQDRVKNSIEYNSWLQKKI